MSGFCYTDLMQTPPLRFSHLAPDTWSALEQIPRTGWILWNIPNPETIADHTLDLRKLACSLHPDLGLNEVEFDKLLDMLEIHDWAESIVGDIAVDALPLNEQKHVASDKRYQERQAMQKICNEISQYGTYIFDLFDEHENRTTKISNIAFHIDKIHADIKAVEYEVLHKVPGMAWEFLNCDKKRFTLPLFKKMWQEFYDNPDIFRDYTR